MAKMNKSQLRSYVETVEGVEEFWESKCSYNITLKEGYYFINPYSDTPTRTGLIYQLRTIDSVLTALGQIHFIGDLDKQKYIEKVLRIEESKYDIQHYKDMISRMEKQIVELKEKIEKEEIKLGKHTAEFSEFCDKKR